VYTFISEVVGYQAASTGKVRFVSARKLLLVEDNRGDARLIAEMLNENGGDKFKLRREDSLAGAEASLDSEEVDLVVLDLGLPDSVGIETFEQVRRKAPRVPIIVLTGLNDEDLAVRAVAAGAQDYLVKGQVDSPLLVRSVRYAIEREQSRQKINTLNAELEQRVIERTLELAEANKALEKANEDLRQLDRMKTSFIRVTSHELNTPMQVVLGMLSVMEEQRAAGKQNDNGHRDALEVAVRGANRLRKLVERVLKIAVLGEYKVRLERTPTVPGELLQQVVTDVSPYIKLRGQTLEMDIPDGLPKHSMDWEKVRDVLLNLLTNAIKFTPDGGTIKVAARDEGDQGLLFSVSDNGSGIPEPERSHIFDEFFVSFDTIHHSSGEYEFGKRGIGLGLSIAKDFVTMHGGKIWVDTKEGEGSTFYFTIPVEEADKQAG